MQVKPNFSFRSKTTWLKSITFGWCPPFKKVSIIPWLLVSTSNFQQIVYKQFSVCSSRLIRPNPLCSSNVCTDAQSANTGVSKLYWTNFSSARRCWNEAGLFLAMHFLVTRIAERIHLTGEATNPWIRYEEDWRKFLMLKLNILNHVILMLISVFVDDF